MALHVIDDCCVNRRVRLLSRGDVLRRKFRLRYIDLFLDRIRLHPGGGERFDIIQGERHHAG